MLRGAFHRSSGYGWTAGFLVVVLGFHPGPAVAQQPAGMTGAAQARIWFYRQFSPAEPPTPATVRINGAVTGTAIPGRRFYRDVAPGAYHLTVDSFAKDTNQDKDLTLAPGQEVYVKIESLRSRSSYFNYSRDTFYVWPVSAAVGRAEMAQTID